MWPSKDRWARGTKTGAVRTKDVSGGAYLDADEVMTAISGAGGVRQAGENWRHACQAIKLCVSYLYRVIGRLRLQRGTKMLEITLRTCNYCSYSVTRTF